MSQKVRNLTPTEPDILGCPRCDLISRIGAVEIGQKAECPRCGYRLLGKSEYRADKLLAYSVTAVVLLIFALTLDFIQYDSSGLTQSMTLLDAAWQLSYFHEKLLAVIVLLTVILYPLLYLFSLIAVFVAIKARASALARYFLRLSSHVKPWLMVDVFLLGTLISLIKISGLANVQLKLGFWLFCGFVAFLLVTYYLVNTMNLWSVVGKQTKTLNNAKAGITAYEQGYKVCEVCHRLVSFGVSDCPCCGDDIDRHWWRSPQATLALIVAATLLLIPAHWLPIMETVRFGAAQPSTIIGGVIELWQSGDAPIAAIVFIASLVIPVAKILALLGLMALARWQTPQAVNHRLVLYKVTDWIGRWSMIDIFVVAILVALVRSGTVMSVYPGAAAIAFGAAVVLTMLAAMSFDTRLFWREAEK